MASLAPLATVADLTALGVDTSDPALVGALLDSVSAAVRDAAGATISQTTPTVTVTGSDDQWLTLPGGPVTAVDTVDIDGVTVTDYLLRDGMLWRRCGWLTTCEPSAVTATYTQGYAPVPADIVRLVCMYVAMGVAQSQSGYDTRGLQSEKIDDYQVSYLQGDAEIVDQTGLTDRTKQDLARRFGGGVYVTSPR